MVNLGTTKYAIVIVAIGIISIAGTNLAFAQQPCGSQPYAYIACGTTTPTAQMYGGILVAGIVAFAAGCGAAGVKYHTPP